MFVSSTIKETTNEQTNQQTNEQTNNRTKNKTNKLSNKQTNNNVYMAVTIRWAFFADMWPKGIIKDRLRGCKCVDRIHSEPR